MEIKGKYNTAICYAKTLEDTARTQIENICNCEAFSDNKIRIMPDVHAGKGCTIGTTMTLTDKVVPAMVGVDIGCGMEVTALGKTPIDFAALDDIIRRDIPSGMNIHTQPSIYSSETMFSGSSELKCKNGVDIQRAKLSLGTLGGGNHFIEIDQDDEGNNYLVIHSGSRHLGVEICNYYQRIAEDILKDQKDPVVAAVIAKLKKEGRANEIQATLQKMKQETTPAIPLDLAYLSGLNFDYYIHDMHLAQFYARVNRHTMTSTILAGLGVFPLDSFTTIHNYIDTENMILRKGAVSAAKNEELIIPINMKDGSLICVGKGNPDWNCSAPHGSGRLMSRSAAKSDLQLDQYKQEMSNVYSTCIGLGTIDEAPMAYKSLDEIVSQIGPTVDIVKRIHSVYNFKAVEQEPIWRQNKKNGIDL